MLHPGKQSSLPKLLMLYVLFTGLKKYARYFHAYHTFFYHGTTAPSGSRPPHYRGFMITPIYAHHTRQDSSERVISPTQRTTSQLNTHKKQTSMPQVGFEHTIPASELPQTRALDREATRTSIPYITNIIRR